MDETLQGIVTKQNTQITSLNGQMVDMNGFFATLNGQITSLNGLYTNLNSNIGELESITRTQIRNCESGLQRKSEDIRIITEKLEVCTNTYTYNM